METRLIVFLILVFISLLGNAAVMWFLYQSLARSAKGVARYQESASDWLPNLRAGLERLEIVSERAAEWSGKVRSGVVDAGTNVGRADNWLHYGLAKVEFKVDRISNAVNQRANRMEAVVLEPLSRIRLIVQSANALLEILLPARADRNGHY